MYELGAAFSGVEVQEGTNLLIEGPPMSGKRDLGFQILSDGIEGGEGAIVVTTKDGADRVLEDFADLVAAQNPTIGVVDCVTKQQGMGTQRESDLVRYASSPNDLTGIGIELSELLRTLYEQRGVQKNRILLHSLSTLLMYSDLQTVFRFMHVFTGRVQSADALGAFVVDSTAHDEQTVSTLKQLFDGVISIQERDDGFRARLLGVGDDDSWREL
ncbi:RAD55 family ATPase [Halobacterium jilantaiense]|uniref:RecA-superfamily ATPase, KaiC/GvpD/RAD55 family n=1 Tax=Halobacterium jilantaiense TaxID=355548 RepID=A0A1I0NJF6_9EURY|nr:recombinase RecA [Halobacterium jilantaiense]SEW01582.1 RecA-superfamily ATPase, KaiC/GvpD/RAD55 family [Halobacterium jilantaiense]